MWLYRPLPLEIRFLFTLGAKSVIRRVEALLVSTSAIDHACIDSLLGTRLTFFGFWSACLEGVTHWLVVRLWSHISTDSLPQWHTQDINREFGLSTTTVRRYSASQNLRVYCWLPGHLCVLRTMIVYGNVIYTKYKIFVVTLSMWIEVFNSHWNFLTCFDLLWYTAHFWYLAE